MNELIQTKLDWPLIINQLCDYCQTTEAKERTKNLSVDLSREEILERWSLVKPLKYIWEKAYNLPIGELDPFLPLKKFLKMGRIIEGEGCLNILRLLESTREMSAFAFEWKESCSTLKSSYEILRPLSPLSKKIHQIIDEHGILRDNASPLLHSIREGKKRLARSIEKKITELIHKDETIKTYLQDDFFTKRSDRYVIPIRLDGNERVQGNIVDTSQGGQTLYIEPFAVAALNHQLQEFDVSEKIEIFRIFSELTKFIVLDLDTLEDNYLELVRLDYLWAQVRFSGLVKGNCVDISESPALQLIDARHPVLMMQNQETTKSNTISLDPGQNTLIISGPNAGGKTIVLKTVGLLHLMLSSGLMIPADSSSQMFLFKNIFTEMGDAQNIEANLSTFSGHIKGLKPIVDQASETSLILLDEIAVGTEPQTGEALAEAILEYLSDHNATTIVSTHYSLLKTIALKNKRFRNGSMEFSSKTLLPTYTLILDIPGQSFGLEVAENLGFNPSILEHAYKLRGKTTTKVDAFLQELQGERDKIHETYKIITEEKDKAQIERLHWEREVAIIKERKQKSVEKLTKYYKDELGAIKLEIDQLTKELKTLIRLGKISDSSQIKAFELQKTALEKTATLQEKTLDLEKTHLEKMLPGKEAVWEKITVGDKVYVIHMEKEGSVVKKGSSAKDHIEIQSGLFRIKAHVHQLRMFGK